MTQITIDVSDELPFLQSNVEVLSQKMEDLTPLMRGIGGILEGSTRQRFTDKKAYDGTAWANLMPSTQRQKGGNNILVKSDDLRKSITNHATQHTVTVGTSEIYGVYHQLGTSGMAARPFLGLSETDKTDIYELIDEILMRD